jgi:hypothetical protein
LLLVFRSRAKVGLAATVPKISKEAGGQNLLMMRLR